MKSRFNAVARWKNCIWSPKAVREKSGARIVERFNQKKRRHISCKPLPEGAAEERRRGCRRRLNVRSRLRGQFAIRM